MAQKLTISHQALLIIPPAWINIGELNLSDRANREKTNPSTKTVMKKTMYSRMIEVFMLDISPLIIPNLIAGYMCMKNKAYQANLIYSFGYLLFIYHNFKIGDTSQLVYFSILEVMSVIGVMLYYWKKRRCMIKGLESI